MAVAALAIAVGCASPSPMPTPPAHFDDVTVQEAMAWFEERTLACEGPEQPFPDPREWRCTHEFEDGSRLEARITGDRDGVIQLVGLAVGLNPEDAASFLGSTVAILAVPDGDAEALTQWAFNHQETGGQRVFGQASVSLQPHSDERAVVVQAMP